MDEFSEKLTPSPNLRKIMNRDRTIHDKDLASKIIQKVFTAKERESSNVVGLKEKGRKDMTHLGCKLYICPES